MPTAYITVPRDVADDLARQLVDAELAACVNILDCDSIYRWDGTVHGDPEAVLLAKTTDRAFDELVELVAAEHPYDVPCIERFDEADELEAFAAWRDGAVQ